jgi:hypothetical protein
MKTILITKAVTRFSRDIPLFAADMFEQYPQIRGVIYKKEERISFYKVFTRELLLAFALHLNTFPKTPASPGKYEFYIDTSADFRAMTSDR